jgi:hypothetical protein
MTKPFQQWTVLPHGKLAQIDDKLLTGTLTDRAVCAVSGR